MTSNPQKVGREMMTAKLRFSEKVSAELQHYVYRLIDPRDGSTFYVGRGQGNRVFEHADGVGDKHDDDTYDDDPQKIVLIREIKTAGLTVGHVIHRHGMSKESAMEVEAALIDAYPGLTNLVKGQDANRGVMHAQEVIAEYDAPVAEARHNLLLINVNRTAALNDLYDAVRFAWKIDPNKARVADYVLAVRKGVIVGAFKAIRWLEATPENFPGLIRDGFGSRNGRFGFIGEEAPADIKEQYVQKRLPDSERKKGAANPIRYWNK